MGSGYRSAGGAYTSFAQKGPRNLPLVADDLVDRSFTGGAIVNNASVSGVRNPNPGLSLYSASTSGHLPHAVGCNCWV
jgi:hypothetical protein